MVALRLEPANPRPRGDDGKVPVGDQRLPIDATSRTTVIRCLRPDGDIYYLSFAPDPKAKPIVLLHVPVFFHVPVF